MRDSIRFRDYREQRSNIMLLLYKDLLNTLKAGDLNLLEEKIKGLIEDEQELLRSI